MDWMSIVTTITTLFFGGGWFIYYRANKKKAYAEAEESEANAWSKQQEIYQKTIADLDRICDSIREDRNHLRDDRDFLRNENEEMRRKYVLMENEILELKKSQARLGRKIEAMSPFLCGVVGCVTRTHVDVQKQIPDNE